MTTKAGAGARRIRGAVVSAALLSTLGVSCAGSGYPPVPFGVRHAGPMSLTPVFVLEDGYAYWWIESEPGGEVLFVNPANFEQFLLEAKSGRRVVVGPGGGRLMADPHAGWQPAPTGARGMTLDEVRDAGFRASTVEAPVGWLDRAREAGRAEESRRRRVQQEMAHDRVARSVGGEAGSGGAGGEDSAGGTTGETAEPPLPPPPSIDDGRAAAPLVNPFFPAAVAGARGEAR